MIPLHWLTPQEAKILGYKKQINQAICIQRIRMNEPLIEFTLSTISNSNSANRNNTLLRLESPLLRIRIAFYSLLLVSCSESPFLVSFICLISEFVFMLYVLITACKYRHLSSCMSIWSRINISLALMALNFIALYTLLFTEK